MVPGRKRRTLMGKRKRGSELIDGRGLFNGLSSGIKWDRVKEKKVSYRRSGEGGQASGVKGG